MIQRIDLNEPKSIQLLRSRASTVDLEGDISKTVLSIHPSFNANGSIKHEDPETQLMEGYHNLIMMLDVINTSRDEVIAINYFADHTVLPLETIISAHNQFFQNNKVTYCATGQRPAHPQQKVSLEATIFQGAEITHTEKNGATAKVIHLNDMDIIYMMGITGVNQQGRMGSLKEQSYKLFTNADALLKEVNPNATFPANVLRTWIYIHDIDKNYIEFNTSGRDPFFQEQGITNRKQYKTSTGIGMVSPINGAYAQMDVLAAIRHDGKPIEGRELKTKRMNDPADYGKAFIRGADYGPIIGALISGTASINEEGETVHIDKFIEQGDRMYGNVAGLIGEDNDEVAKQNFTEIMNSRVYIKDPNNFEKAMQSIADNFIKWNIPFHPLQLVVGPVCRPNWLLETDSRLYLPNRNIIA